MAALGALAGVLLMAPPTANAAVIPNAITGVTITRADGTDGPLRQYNRLRVDATWAVPDTAQPGDTFSLTIPEGGPDIKAYTSTFDMRDPDGNVVGTCTATTNQIDCTLGDYVATHDNVQGTLFFEGQANQAYDGDKVTWISDGNEIEITLPGGGGVIGSDLPRPTESAKSGWEDLEGGKLTYRIVAPSDTLKKGSTIVDDYDDRLTLERPFWIGWVPDSAWPVRGGNPDLSQAKPLVEGVDYTFTDTGKAFTLTFLKDPEPNSTFVMQYKMLTPEDTKVGDTFDNSAVIAGKESKQTVKIARAGGDGDGDTPKPTPVSFNIFRPTGIPMNLFSCFLLYKTIQFL
ncbi:hypothetical protein CGZ96_02440 [Enemella evansiae]|nr:hypothetical protein CGZ96_02440 [Enemella evansiae]